MESHLSPSATDTNYADGVIGLRLEGGKDRCLAAWLGTTAKGRCFHWGLSVHKYQRYALIFSSIFRPLEGKERKQHFPGPLLEPGIMLGTFEYFILFNPHSNLGSRYYCFPLQ